MCRYWSYTYPCVDIEAINIWLSKPWRWKNPKNRLQSLSSQNINIQRRLTNQTQREIVVRDSVLGLNLYCHSFIDRPTPSRNQGTLLSIYDMSIVNLIYKVKTKSSKNEPKSSFIHSYLIVYLILRCFTISQLC